MRTTRRRLGASVATVLAVTIGAGVLVSPGAVAAPAVMTAASATIGEAKLPLDAEIVSTGDTGYLTSRSDDSGGKVLEWHGYEDGSCCRSRADGLHSNSDIVVTSDGGSTVFLRDMTEGAGWSASYDLASEFKPGAKLVGVVGDNLFVKVPTGSGDYHELWQLARVDGVAKKTKRSSNPYSIDFKVVAATSNVMLVLSSNRVFPSPATFRTEYWKTRTTSTATRRSSGAAEGTPPPGPRPRRAPTPPTTRRRSSTGEASPNSSWTGRAYTRGSPWTAP